MTADPAVATRQPVGLSPRWRFRSGTAPAFGAGGGGPRVLVAFASRHGATREIAAALARWLPECQDGQRAGVSAVLAPVERGPDPAAFDAVVLGSALYAGEWLKPARRYVGAVASELRARPTWLFSSGLAGGSTALLQDGDDARWIGDSIGALAHRVFPGRVERRVLSAAEQHAWPAGPGVAGDFRDWPAVRAWAGEIATQLAARQAAPMAG
ncbi:flavodoxin domain-containing protein [Blastococcus tunisiensis]|uniref:Menaquinone-dependent protoporphyrinogen oxidase n=1 Tax=Blastococcus tunisiensis TaxID=1798228 RepID=A0A1I2EMX9_9ACTN|nr:flavodoxin domain-containing protein [Blastococcus sp. DSM 46838]SFE94215.1 menaquinone-dependent protoporphyrinogen oxidase [Blastococcus sp. DSM 46838]